MKQLIYFLSFILLAGVFAGCSDTGEEQPVKSLLLTASKTTLQANGKEQITFTVTHNGTDVTKKATIWQLAGTSETETEIKEATFSTTTAGDYRFEARYQEEVSNVVSVTATTPPAPTVEKYYRKVCIMKTTGTECSFCPEAERQLEVMMQLGFPNRMVVMAFHGYSNDDPMNVSYTKELVSTFKLGGFPGAITDMRFGISGNSLYSNTKEAITASLKEYPATCGLRVETKITNNKLDVTVGLTSNTGGTYNLGLFVLENGIVYPQKDGGDVVKDYTHNHTVRKMLSKDFMGDPLGEVAANAEQTKSYSVDLSEDWKTENLYVVAYAVDGTGYINNVVECDANNASIDYVENKD